MRTFNENIFSLVLFLARIFATSCKPILTGEEKTSLISFFFNLELTENKILLEEIKPGAEDNLNQKNKPPTLIKQAFI